MDNPGSTKPLLNSETIQNVSYQKNRIYGSIQYVKLLIDGL